MRKIFIITLLIIVYWLLGGKISSVEAAYFQFEPTSLTIKKGETINIKININAGSDNLHGADAYVLYESTYLKVESVTAGSYFPTVTRNVSAAGKVYIAGMVDNPASPVSGAGTLATIVFQALADGQVTLTIDCNLSKIVKDDINATNVMECSQNGQATVTVGTGSSSSSNTSNTSSSSQPTPSVLPKSGIFDNVVRLAIPGMILLFLGAAVKLLL